MNTIQRTGTLATSRFMNYVYNWMVLGVFLTALVAYQVTTKPALLQTIFQHTFIFWGLIIAQLGIVLVLAGGVAERLSTPVTIALYLLYSALTGLTLSIVVFAYTAQSIVSAFGVSAVSFAGLSLFGFVTKRDLGPVGSFCMMGLFGLVGVYLLSIFFPSLMQTTGQLVTSIIGIIVFGGLTAYDTQKIKQLSYSVEVTQTQAIRGALILYLDFINLFLSLLRLMGDRK